MATTLLVNRSGNKLVELFFSIEAVTGESMRLPLNGEPKICKILSVLHVLEETSVLNKPVAYTKIIQLAVD